MELTPKQQIVDLVNKSKKILLLTHLNPDGDALGSILALAMVLKKLDKEVNAICSDVSPAAFKFLPSIEKIKNTIEANKDFIISIDTSKTAVERLGYKSLPKENKLNIVITAKNGSFSADLLSFSYASANFDLIFVLDMPDLERLGKIYDENTDLFYETPLINIDHHAGNDHFGKVNWVDLTATSTCEILVALLESLGREKNLFDPDIATCLLTGLITDTGSFQHTNTTPKSFTVAAQLVAAGARQQEIVRHIYKSKPLSTLKLWGKILSNIHEEKEYGFVWSSVSKNDLQVFQAEESETAGVIDELLKTAPEIDFALLLSEKKNGVHGSLRAVGQGVNVAEIAKIFEGGGHELAAAFQIDNVSLDEVIKEILHKVYDYQAKKLGLQLKEREPSKVSKEDFSPLDEFDEDYDIEGAY